MNVELPSDQQTFLEGLVAAGRFDSVGEAVRGVPAVAQAGRPSGRIDAAAMSKPVYTSAANIDLVDIVSFFPLFLRGPNDKIPPRPCLPSRH
jgi:hypothetical protein